MGWKYIMIESGMYRFPIIFPDKLVHKEVYEVVSMIVPGRLQVKAVSAGEIYRLEVAGVGGDSETLKIKSLGKEDADLINNYNYGHGVV